MSKVHSPKSKREETTATSTAATTLDPGANVGLWTLDFGLEVSDLRKSFLSPSGNRVEVLRGVSFKADRGTVVALRGASGAGKSTLLHLLGGIETVDHGSIRFGQFSVERGRGDEVAEFRNREVGFLFQFHHLLSDLSAGENVSLPLMIGGMSSHRAKDLATNALAKSGLDDRESHPAGSLSGGEQQRVALCRALITQPKLVLADEPTGNLDELAGNQIAADLVAYARSRPAVVVVATHNPALAERCDRNLTLLNGRLYET